MGYLNTANDMVNSSTELLANVLNSKFTTYLQGNGTPTFVTYYHVDETLTTTDTGNYTIDQMLGPNSPLRYNRIEQFPIYGLKDLIPSMDELEGGLYDLNVETDVVILPNTIKPSGYDFFTYTYLDCILLFLVHSFEFTSIKNNDYYKLNVSLRDVNNDFYIKSLEDQTVRGYITKLDNIGSEDKCIIEDKICVEIDAVEKTKNHLIDYYINNFYEERYNCVLLRETPFGQNIDYDPKLNVCILKRYPIYDPWLTKFIIDNNILDTKKRFLALVNTDYRGEVTKTYNNFKTIYKAIEDRDISKLSVYYMEPVTFKTYDTNPFVYYGEEVVFTLTLHTLESEFFLCDSDTHGENVYGSKELIEKILGATIEKLKDDYLKARPDPTVIKHNRDRIITKYSTVSPEDLSSAYEDDFTQETSIKKLVSLEDEPTEETPEPEELSPFYLEFICKYLTKESLYDLFTMDDLHKLMSMEMDDGFINFLYIPILIYILDKYIKFLSNNKM